MLMLYILVRWLMQNPAESPVAYITDGILLVAVFLFTLLYRNALPDRKATLKELMLLGLGTAVVASVLYGIFLWAFGLCRSRSRRSSSPAPCGARRHFPRRRRTIGPHGGA